MKKILLLHWTIVSICLFWTVDGNAQENIIQPPPGKIKSGTIKTFRLKNTVDNLKSKTLKRAGSNLIPVQLIDWDDKIVVSTVEGVYTSASVIYDNQTIYLDFGLGNDGTSGISETFTNELYIDGVFARYFDVAGLDAGNGVAALDVNIGILAAGTHSFRFVVDANDDVAETDENDNEYSRTITVTSTQPTVCANLIPYQRTGWDDKIVLSTVSGTNTSATNFNDNQVIYLDWALRNNGTCNISAPFTTKVYLDNVEISALEVPSLDAGFNLSKPDIEIGPLAAGNHTFRMVGDANGNVSETNENDNEYSRTITVNPVVCVNITPTQPAGWDDKLVVSTVTGTTSSTSEIADNQPIYLDWALKNTGSCGTPVNFTAKVFVDDALIATTDIAGLVSNNTYSKTDINIGMLAAGSHTIKIVGDANAVVTETNEGDNEYIRTISVSSTICANLSPYTPQGWDDEIVLSTRQGTTSSAATIYSDQNIYLDWALDNNGTCDISETFYTKIYVDDALKGNYRIDGIPVNYYSFIIDLNIGKLAAGSYTVKMVIDADAQVAETNESENEYTRTLDIEDRASAALEQRENLASILVYPNPLSNELFIEFKGNRETIGFEVMNVQGQIIYQGELLERTIIQTSGLSPGYYLIKFISGKSSEFRRIIKE
jgi:subtilase family serine protease